jgi:hypothetical protein
MSHRSIVPAAFVLLAAGAALGGCAKSNKDLLPGAVYAQMVPVYKNAALKDQMGSESWGDEPDSYTKGQAWFFETKETQATLIAFYEKEFPNAQKTVNDDGSVTFRIIPEGAERFEDVNVTLRDHQVLIAEDCRPGKIKN